MKEPQITVGILSSTEIEFFFPEDFQTTDGTLASGMLKVTYHNGKIQWMGKGYDEICFSPQESATTYFELKDVVIGINFHWERKETQRFKGSLKIIIEDDKLTAVNVISVEDYLTSVISSEMSATASLDLLKAHAVISRSWLLEKLRVKDNNKQQATSSIQTEGIQEPKLIKWYDTEAHKHFNVCADDHCQRYQGITRASTLQAIEAVSSTRGEVLMYDAVSAMPVFQNAVVVLSKSFRIAGRM